MFRMLLAAMLLAVSLKAAVCEEADTMKEMRWGNQVKDVALAVKPNKSEYEIGDDIQLEIFVKNFGKGKAEILTVGGREQSFRIELFDDEGTPVAKTSHAKKVDDDAEASTDISIPTRSVAQLESGGESTTRIMLNKYFDIQKPGTYRVIIMRRLWAWEKGFLVSNMAKIQIVERQATTSE